MSMPAAKLRWVLLPAVAVAAIVIHSASSATVSFSDFGAGLPGTYYGTNVWGDYDGDGDLDLLISGDTGSGLITRVYRYSASGFANAGFSLAGAQFCSGAWGDYDGDNDLDILLTGRDTAGVSRTWIYTNNGVFGFTELAHSLPGVVGGSSTWADYDNDGDLDILICGQDAANVPVTCLARNDGAGVFTIVNSGIQGLLASTACWGDYDNDGDLDLLLLGGEANLYAQTRIYRNDGEGVFTDILANVTPVLWGTAAWGDYDCDGDLDLVIAGSNRAYEPITTVYRNDGAGVFTDIGAGLIPLRNSSVAWGDYDNNGTLDMLIAGQDGGTGPTTCIYRGDGVGGFTQTAFSFTQLGEGQLGWGDYDADGDLDFVVSGRASGFLYTIVYRSTGASPNSAPSAPGNLTSTLIGDRVLLSWTPSVDSETPQDGLTYNLRVGTTSGGSQIMSAMARADGRRLVPDLGNTGEKTSWLVDVRSVRYFWSVQAVDGAYAGSVWPTERAINLADAGDEIDALDARLGPATPNPSSGTVRIPLELKDASAVHIAIYDASGRCVRRLIESELAAGHHVIDWDGANDAGVRVGAGFYLCRVQAGSTASSGPIVRLD